MLRAREVGLILGVLALGACARNDMSDLEAFIDEVKAREGGPIAPIPEIRQPETFTYEARDRRPPFTPPVEQVEVAQRPRSDGPRPDENRRREELENYPLDTLKMVGTLVQNDTDWGLVQTSEGTVHRVREGNYLGQNHGRITRILEEKIELTELVEDGLGGYNVREQAMALGDTD